MSTISVQLIPPGVVAILGASMIAVTPVMAPPPSVPAPGVQLTSMADFLTEGLGLSNLVDGSSGSLLDDLGVTGFDPTSYTGLLDSILDGTNLPDLDLPDLDSILSQVFNQFGTFGPILNFIFTGPLGFFFQPLLLLALPLVVPIVLPMLLDNLDDGTLPLPDLPDGTSLLSNLVDSFGDLASVGLTGDTTLDPDVVSDLVNDFVGTSANSDFTDIGAALPDLLSAF